MKKIQPVIKNYISDLLIKVVELIEALTVFGVLGTVLASIILVLFRLVPQKTVKKALDKTITQQNQTIIEQSNFIKDRYESDIRRLNKKNRDLENELNPVDDEGDPIQKEVPWETLMAGAQQMGISPILLLPFKKQILSATKGMSIEEIQQMAAAGKGSIGGLLGGKQSQAVESSEFGSFDNKELR